MHLSFSLCLLILSLCCAVESIHDPAQDEQFRKQSKDIPGMKNCSCLIDYQINFMNAYFEKLIRANEENISVDLKREKYNNVGITHIFHMALDVLSSETVDITLLGVQQYQNKDMKLLRDDQGKLTKSLADLTRDAAVKQLKKYFAYVEALVDGSAVIEKASYFYDDSLWRNPEDMSAGPYLQYAIALVRKDLKDDIRVESGKSTPEKNNIFRKFTSLFKTS